MIHTHRVSSRDELIEWWARVREGLIANVEHHGEVDAPERVYQSITAGSALLHLIFDDEEYLGFVVTAVEGVGIRACPYLHLWQVYAPGLLDPERFAGWVAAVDRLAGEQGLTTIRMNTTRPGWARLMRDHAAPVLTEYERKVPHGSNAETAAG